MSFFKDFFDSSKPEEQEGIPPEEEEVLEKVATWVVRRQMSVPAIMFLESIKPLNYIGSQAMVFFEPMVQALFSVKEYNKFRIAMERRENVENLLQKIEHHDAIAYRKEKIYKKKVKKAQKSWKWYQRWLGIKTPKIEITAEEIEQSYQEEKAKMAEKRNRKKKK